MDDDVGSGLGTCQREETSEATGGAGDQDRFSGQGLLGHPKYCTAS
jgi:hypothetical protein